MKLIKDLPNEIKLLVYRNQEIQGNFNKFNGDLSCDKSKGNFDWRDSLEDSKFWHNIFRDQSYEIPPSKEIDYDIY